MKQKFAVGTKVKFRRASAWNDEIIYTGVILKYCKESNCYCIRPEGTTGQWNTSADRVYSFNEFNKKE